MRLGRIPPSGAVAPPCGRGPTSRPTCAHAPPYMASARSGSSARPRPGDPGVSPLGSSVRPRPGFLVLRAARPWRPSPRPWRPGFPAPPSMASFAWAGHSAPVRLRRDSCPRRRLRPTSATPSTRRRATTACLRARCRGQKGISTREQVRSR